MPMPPAEKPSGSRVVTLLPSPREAAQRALVYRRRRAERPRERGLRIAAFVGTLLVHLLVLVGAILGPAYELVEPPPQNAEPLQVRLITHAPEPPPPPPVRGLPPRKPGPTHRGSAVPNAPRRVERSAAAPAVAALQPVPVPAPQPPVITVTAEPATIKLAPVAAPRPPASLPRPKPSPELKPVPLAGEPPQVALDTPPVPKPVPPKFQPEPMRKPQPEGNQPLQTPPSLTLPELPAQAPPAVSAPSIALDATPPKPAVTPSTMALAQPESPASPPTQELEAVPLPAQPAPQVNLQPQLSAPAPSVPRERTQVQAPTIRLAEPELAPVSAAEQAPSVQVERPAAPSLDTRTIQAPRPSLPAIARPQLSVASEPSSSRGEEAAKAPAANSEAQASSVAAPENAAAESSAKGAQESSAPQTTPQGSETATPGQPEGTANAAPSANANANGQATPSPAHGRGSEGEGKLGEHAQAGAAEGAEKGRFGSYIQLQPHGDTQIMEHRAPNIGYRPTRFEQDWTPEGESSIDTALRRAVEKTTIKHTFHLPRGVRVECKLLPLMPVALFGCDNPDPPPRPVADKVYERMHLAPANPLLPLADATGAPASAATAAVPIKLDDSAECAAARVAGGPLPPGCATEAAAPVRPALAAPARSSSSWVPASDQF